MEETKLYPHPSTMERTEPSIISLTTGIPISYQLFYHRKKSGTHISGSTTTSRTSSYQQQQQKQQQAAAAAGPTVPSTPAKNGDGDKGLAATIRGRRRGLRRSLNKGVTSCTSRQELHLILLYEFAYPPGPRRNCRGCIARENRMVWG